MSTKEKVISALENAEGQYVSGGKLADMIGVSRNAVWKAVNSLKDDGFNIDAVSNNGYRLIPETSSVYENRVRKYLTASELGKKIICFKEIDSTNNYAKKIAHENAEHGTAVISEIQTAGKGRMGRTFVSPSNTGIYISIIIKNSLKTETAQLITSCTAVSVCQAIDKVCGTDTRIKWVNDIFLNGKKICGILTEASMSFETGALEYAVIGIGINVYSVKNVFDCKLLETASSIEDECNLKADRSRICAEILNSLEKNLQNLDNHDFISEYKRRSCITGNYVMVSKGNAEKKAFAYDIDDNACLKVRYEDGSEEALNSGEARIIKIQ